VSNDQSPRGWYSRGYLPHFDAGSTRTQFITCRLYDALPDVLLKKIRKELKIRSPDDIERQTLILAEKYMDRGHGQCFLRKRPVAEIVRASLMKYHQERYRLFAWVIMPNHIHLLLRALPGYSLEQIFHSFKSYTALQANRALDRKGPFWMREFFDRYIRDADHFDKALSYIENNPVKAGLRLRAEDWEVGRAGERSRGV
jgi:putative DNA methylase